MPITADRDAVQSLVADRNAQLVEVLPQDEYDEEHLPGAIHLPLRQLDDQTAARLDAGRPVIVYCWDGL